MLQQQTDVRSTVDGIDYVEIYVSNWRQASHYYRTALGFTVVGPPSSAGTPGDRVTIDVRQGDIRLRLTAPLTPDSEVAEHLRLHGEGVKDVAFVVRDVRAAFDRAVAQGASVLRAPSPQQVEGDAVETAQVAGPVLTHTLIQRSTTRPRTLGAAPARLVAIDHLALAVPPGDLPSTVAFYRQAFGFHETHQENVTTEYSAMRSKVVQSPNGRVRFPIMEPAPGRRRSQIATYVESYGGSGVQHLAFQSDAIVTSIATLADAVEFLPTPAPYYDAVPARIGELPADFAALRRHGVLIDRDATGLLLQVFTKPIGARPTLFLELIERRGAEGFGGGNIKALFEAVERADAQGAAVLA